MSTAAPAAGRAFLDAICRTPADDTPRLIFADFLEEHGEAERAEFIRVQCEAARLEADLQSDEVCGAAGCECERLAALRRREGEMLTAQVFWEWFGYEEWLLHGWPGSPAAQVKEGREVCVHGLKTDRQWYVSLRRGFVAAVTLPCADFLRHARALFACQPVEEVRLGDREPLRQEFIGHSPRWGWWDREEFGLTAPDNLPAPLWALLRGGEAMPPRGSALWRWYTAEPDARAALSAACVAFGREAAGLPPLPPPG